MGSHSRFSPSATDRDTLCPPSFLLNEQAPDRNSDDSAHGTAAHYVGQLCLSNNHDMVLYAGCVLAVDDTGESRFVHENAPPTDAERVYEVDDEMCVAVQAYVDWCREVAGDHFVEVRLEHTRYCPDVDEWGDPMPPQFGTSDHVCIDHANKTIYVTDLKYGKGVKVFALRNKQATKYALGAVDEYDWTYGFTAEWAVVIRICQPRLDHFDVWDTTVGELRSFGEEIKIQLVEVFNPEAPFNPGEKQCKFCKVAGRCRALDEHIQTTRALWFEDESGAKRVDRRLLTLEEIELAYSRHELYKIRFDAIERELRSSLIDGEEGQMFKVVNANTKRRWIDDDAAREALTKLGLPKTAILKQTLVSPNQAEKLLVKEKKEEIAELWVKPPGGPCIVLKSDKREPYTAQRPGLEAFDDEEFDDGFNP